jgi:hypothetical protein
MRAEIVSWSSENGNCVNDAFHDRIGTKYEYKHVFDIPVGLMGGIKYMAVNYPTVLHAIGDGWKLLAPPTKYTEKQCKVNDEDQDGDELYVDVECFEWWLTKD